METLTSFRNPGHAPLGGMKHTAPQKTNGQSQRDPQRPTTSAPEPVAEDRMAMQYRKVIDIDKKIEQYEIGKYRTLAYWDLGEAATRQKGEMKHGEWLPFLTQRDYVERTVQRAMRIFEFFQDRREECGALTLQQAESASKRKKSSHGNRNGKKPSRSNGKKPSHGDDSEAAKAERLYKMAAEATDEGFAATAAQHKAFAAFVKRVGDQDLAIRVALSCISSLL